MGNTSSSPHSIRWGILATGNIAHTFAADLALVEGAELAAVGSRNIESASRFAHEFGVGRAYGTYAELAADPDLDVIYVATPHGRHVDDVLTCFEAGKAVLCEKAMALDVAGAAMLIDQARHRRLFFAEAMWTRCNPNIRRIRELVAAGACGTIGQVRAELGFVAPKDFARLWDPALGASALLDVGIYPLTLANLILGEPVDIAATGVLSDRGIDINGGATLTYASGAVASIAWTQVAHSDNRAAISGDEGRIEIPSRFHEATGFSYARGSEVLEVAEPLIGRAYAHEIIEVNECLRAGRTESALLPLDDTLEIMRQMEIIRELIG